MAAVAVARASAWRADRELVDLQNLMEQQSSARHKLHQAVFAQNPIGMQEGIVAVASGLLLPIEGQWAERELKAILSQLDAQQRREKAASDLAKAMHGTDADELERSINAAQVVGQVVAEDITAAEMRLFNLRTQEQRQNQGEIAWKEVEKAVEAGSVEQLLAALSRHDGVLPPERKVAAQRKIPGMQARADLRRELAAAMTLPISVARLQHVISSARRSCLPHHELVEAEAHLREAEAEARRRAVERAAEVEAAKKKQAKAEADAIAQAAADSVSVAASFASVPLPTPPKMPSTPLEEAVQSGERAQVQVAVADLKKSGLSAREIQRLYSQAMADFGHK